VSHARSDELCRLADDGDAGGVLSIVTLDEIAQEWCDLTAAAIARVRDDPSDDDGEPGPEWWPQSFLFNCLPSVPHLHRELFVGLVRVAPHRVRSAHQRCEPTVARLDPARPSF